MTELARIAADAVQKAVDTRATGSQASARTNALRDHTKALSKGFRFRRKRAMAKIMAPAITTIARRGNGTGTGKPRTRIEAPQKTIRVRDWTKRKRATGATDWREKPRSCISAIKAKLMGTRTLTALIAVGIYGGCP